MNTGIGDAVNLAWKLASVLQGRADPSLLDSYEPERIAFARRLVATTDRAFQFINNAGPIARFARVRLVPLLLPTLFSFQTARRLLFLTISQTNVNYRARASLIDSAARVEAGDRLPWVRLENGKDNFEGLRSLDWQAHVYGETSGEMERLCARAELNLQRFPWSAAAGRAGIIRNGFYLIRPDGYIGLAASGDPAAALHGYQARLGLAFGPAGARSAAILAAALRLRSTRPWRALGELHGRGAVHPSFSE